MGDHQENWPEKYQPETYNGYLTLCGPIYIRADIAAQREKELILATLGMIDRAQVCGVSISDYPDDELIASVYAEAGFREFD